MKYLILRIKGSFGYAQDDTKRGLSFYPARQNAVRSVDFCRVQMYWKIGRRIQEEQKGKERADYGAYLLKNLAKRLEPEYGSGFSYRQYNYSFRIMQIA